METAKFITAMVIVAAFLVIVSYDLFAFIYWGNPATLSRLCLDTANRYRGFAVLITFSVGVLFGHLFLPQHE